MKKIFIAIACVATLAFANSCQKGPKAGDLVDTTFTATLTAIDYTSESKAAINNLAPTFADGDQVAVYDGFKTNPFTVSTATTPATLKGQAGYQAEAFFAAFPAEIASEFSASSVKLNLPAEQKVGQDVILAVGKADAQNAFTLKNAAGYIEVAVPEGAKSVEVSSSSEQIAGAITVNPETGKVKEVAGQSKVTLAPASGAFTEGKYLVAVAPAQYTEISVSTVLANGAKVSKKATELNVERGMVTKIDSVAVSESTEYAITSAADLQAWAAASESWSADDVVTLENDIDMSSITWTPVSFGGTFDGKGHNIYNFVQTIEVGNSGFFGYMNGTVKNVNFGTKDGSKYDGVSKITIKGTDNGSWWYVGVFGKVYGDITDVKNFVNVEIDKDCTGKIRGAAVVGLAGKPDMKLTNIDNYGTFTSLAEGKTTTTETIFGGVVACADAGEAGLIVYLTKCNNHGAVLSLDPFTTCVGGVLSNCPSKKCAVLEDCHNYANVAINSTATPDGHKEGYVGGVVGLLNGNSQAGIELKNCTNESDLKVSGITVGDIGGIAGRNSCAVYTNCVNKGNITFDGNVAGKAIMIGGIAGGIYTGGTIENCTNEGNITTNKNQNHRVGGIVGTLNTGTITIKNCTNKGSLSIVRTAANDNWQAIGGIIGFQEKSDKVTIEGCANSGAVKCEMENNTPHKNQICAGGLYGMLVVNVDSKNNVNTGNVTINTTGSAKTYAGGVIGWSQAATITSTGDQSSCEVNSVTYAGAVAGSNGGTQYDYTKNPVTETALKAGVFTGVKVSGKVNGKTLTADNVKALAVGSGSEITDVTLK